MIPGAREAAEQVRSLLESGATRIGLVGPAGSGKSSALAVIAEELGRRGRRVMRVRMPRLGDDVAVIGLMEVTLESGSEPLLAHVRDPRIRWGVKLRESIDCVDQEDVTLLLDDPWFPGAPIASVFSVRAEQLSRELLSVRRAAVVVASRHMPELAQHTIRVRAGSDPHEVLARLRQLPMLRAAAEALARSNPTHLARYSPLELGLAALAVTNGASAGAVAQERWSPLALVEKASERLSPDARALLGALALVRVPFGDDLLDRLGISNLSPDERVLVEQVFLIRREATLSLHDIIARNTTVDGPARNTAHRALAAWHHLRFEQLSGAREVRDAIRHELEEIHHLTEARDAKAVLSASIYFSDQYDALGKALSIGHQYAAAVDAYERALAHDPEDAYAHHYLAFNLDVQGLDANRALAEYSRARDLEPTHVWYQGRRINLLITIGRLKEARIAWGEALSQLAPASDDVVIANELHRQVALLLLHRGQLDFARRVLGETPAAARTEEWFRTLERHLHDMREAERQELLFPAGVPLDSRWEGPHLIRDPGDSGKLREWSPGRVTHGHADGGIRVLLGHRVAGQVRLSYRDFAASELRDVTHYARHGLTIPVGTFVELFVYQDGTEQLLSWPREPSTFPELFPRPDRYIRRGLASV
jgi:tetratricopeptide (TPR) repeat protein